MYSVCISERMTMSLLRRCNAQVYGRTGIHIGYNGLENAPRDLSERCEKVAPEKLKTVIRHPIKRA